MKSLSVGPERQKRGRNEFCDWLVGDRARLRKGERTRKELMETCARLLATEPFDQLTVSALCKTAGVAHGTFYVYFDNLNAILAEVLGLFVDYVELKMLAAARLPGDPSRNSTAAYFELFKTNAGFMKCLVMGMDAFLEARMAFQRLNNEWAKIVVRSHAKGHKVDSGTENEMMRRAYALGGMVDQYLTALFVTEDPWLAAISEDSDAVITTLTTLWKKGMQE